MKPRYRLVEPDAYRGINQYMVVRRSDNETIGCYETRAKARIAKRELERSPEVETVTIARGSVLG